MTKQTVKDRPGVIAPPPLVYLVVFALGYYLQRTSPLDLPNYTWIDILAKVIAVASLLLAASAMIIMKRAGTHIDVYKPTKAIVDSGPFAFSRNPIYLTLTSIYICTAIITLQTWALILLPLAILIMHYGVILREERYLDTKFGNEYRSYKAKVRRWL